MKYLQDNKDNPHTALYKLHNHVYDLIASYRMQCRLQLNSHVQWQLLYRPLSNRLFWELRWDL